MQILFNIFLSAGIISLALWIAKNNPVLGGFIVSLPIATLIVLAFNKLQTGDDASSYVLAKSIFIGIPTTLLFFIPFLLAERFKLSFWICYTSGLALLGVGYYAHKYLTQFLIK